MKPRHILLIGGTSEIGLAVAEGMLRDDTAVTLAGRPSSVLDAAVDRLRTDGREIRAIEYDARWDTTRTEMMLDTVWETEPQVDAVIIAVGTMGPRNRSGQVASIVAHGVREPSLEELIEVNLVGPALAANGCAARLAASGLGTIVVISSIAAVRPRDDILGYASAKRALDTFTLGLDHRMRRHGGRCLVVRPGRVATRMTAGMPPVPFLQTPEDVAATVRRALAGRAAAAWSPPVLGVLTAILGCIPRRLVPPSVR